MNEDISDLGDNLNVTDCNEGGPKGHQSKLVANPIIGNYPPVFYEENKTK